MRRVLPWFFVVACSSENSPPSSHAATEVTGTPSRATTTVRVHYAGKSGTLTLRGGAAPLSWDSGVPLAAERPGVYAWTSTDVKAPLELKPMLDATWSRGPNYRVLPGKTLDVYPHFHETHGRVERQPPFTSQKLPSTRGLWIYLPPTYVENSEARFGVLYMHDAQNLFTPETAFGGTEWRVDETLDSGAEDGSIAETIVVGIENGAHRIDELTPSADPSYGGGRANEYLDMVISEIKPKIDAELRTVPARERTAILGSSLGSLVSAYAGVHRADVFGLVGEMSPSTWWDGKMILGEVSSMAESSVRPERIYVDSGDSGNENDGMADTIELAARYRSVGYADGKNFQHVVARGGMHNEASWAARLPAVLHFLLGGRDRPPS